MLLSSESRAAFSYIICRLTAEASLSTNVCLPTAGAEQLFLLFWGCFIFSLLDLFSRHFSQFSIGGNFLVSFIFFDDVAQKIVCYWHPDVTYMTSCGPRRQSGDLLSAYAIPVHTCAAARVTDSGSVW